METRKSSSEQFVQVCRTEAMFFQGQDTAGIFHWSGDEKMTKYSMAVAMAEAFSLPTNHIQADRNPSGGATRPYDAHLDCSRAQSLGIGQRTPFKSTIREILEPFYP